MVVLFFSGGPKLPLQELWFALGLCLTLAGMILFLRARFQEASGTAPVTDLAQKIESLRESGLKVMLTLDNCEVKSRSFQQEVVLDRFPSQAEAFGALLDEERAYRAETIRQTYVVVLRSFDGLPYKFISDPADLDESAARFRLEESGGALFINPKNPHDYYFELPF